MAEMSYSRQIIGCFNRLKDDEIDDLFEEADKDGSGKIEVEEFIILMKAVNDMSDIMVLSEVLKALFSLMREVLSWRNSLFDPCNTLISDTKA